MFVDLAFIRAFLRRPGIEGQQRLRGYIPCRRISDGKGKNYVGPAGTDARLIEYPATGDPGGYVAMGASGVTVATGVDLGQSSVSALLRAGLEQGVVNPLRPYLGLKKDAAMQKLHDLPLAVSQSVADDLDRAIHETQLLLISSRYNSDNPARPFEDLPKQAQAAIFSLLYQRGCSGGPNHAPRVWAAFLRGDWADASARLCNGTLWNDYRERRAAEGRLLKEAA